MARRSCFLLFAMLFISLTLCTTARAEWIAASRFASESHEIDRHGYQTVAQATAYEQLFEKYYPDELTSALQIEFPPDELQRRFDAAFATFFYTQESRYIPIMLRNLDKLEATNAATATDYTRMYQSLLAARDFESARDFARRNRLMDVEPLPASIQAVEKAAAPSLWSVSTSNSSLQQSSYEMPNGPVIIMIGAPNCHFSQNALRDIKRDPMLLALITPILKLVSPPTLTLGFSDFQKWNQSNPTLPFSLAHKINEWPMFPDWATPNFYFFRDKKLKATVTGWPREGRMNELKEALVAIGVK